MVGITLRLLERDGLDSFERIGFFAIHLRGETTRDNFCLDKWFQATAIVPNTLVRII